jgi:hypothetical protein
LLGYGLQAAMSLFILARLGAPGRQLESARIYWCPEVMAGLCGILIANSIVFGTAWWTVSRERPSARFWVILPSFLFLTLSVLIVCRYPAYSASAMFPLGFGLAGPAVTWQHRSRNVPAQPALIGNLAGDGTSNLLNKVSQFLATAAYLAAWLGCNFWVHHNRLPRMDGGLLIVFLAGFLTTLVHELGHTVAGLAMEMRLRAFVGGPFEFRKREGRWSFKFNPADILTDNGATGVVPTSARQPRHHLLAMIAAGPLTNLGCGLIALGLADAFSMPDSAHRALAYPFALFGLYGIIGFVVNLIPLRCGPNYSDGAKIVQLLSNGASADLHRAISFVSSSLITPLQPRDYDLATLQRAINGLREGNMSVALRLWAHAHYLDRNMMDESAAALAEAESVAASTCGTISAELCNAFIFGSAYVRRDALAARRWWQRMQANKPQRMNADSYRAESALHWIEGNPTAAHIAWAKSCELSRKLPQAGAYQFERNCCKLLEEAIDGAAAIHLPAHMAHTRHAAGIREAEGLLPVQTVSLKTGFKWGFVRDICQQQT